MSTPLVVPIDVEALVVNHAFRDAQPMRRWGFDYTALWSFDSPEPRAGRGGTTSPPADGVHLRWTLPAALRHGSPAPDQDAGSPADVGDVRYPPVPNRWLIVRIGTVPGGTGRRATAWVLESDCPNPASATQYLVDDAVLAAWAASGEQARVAAARNVPASEQLPGVPVATLGAAFPAGTWRERAATATFLTAVAPGNAVFAAYQPHHENVFSWTDPLTDAGTAPDHLTYLVAGWYSNPSEDPVTGAAAAAALGWTTTAPGELHGSVYQGTALGVPWNQGPDAPPTPLPGLAEQVRVAIGTTEVEALTALVTAQHTAADPELLQAFQYGLLPVFEQVNGPALVQEAAHAAGFGATHGGTGWTIAPESGRDGAPVALTAGEAGWLAELNAVQEQVDAAALALAGARRNLFTTWWKWQKGVNDAPDDFPADAYRTAVRTTLPQAVTAARTALTTVLPGVPQPAPQPGDTREQAYERGVARFAAGKGLGAGKVLTGSPGPRYRRAADPVVLLSGLAPAGALDPSATLSCRTSVVDALVVDGHRITAGTLGAALPALSAPGVPAVCAALLTEAFLLDTANAAAIGAAAGLPATDVAAAMSTRAAPAYPDRALPALGLGQWAGQPWSPLFLEWQVDYVHIPYTTSGARNWSFDGHDYRFTGPFGPFAGDPAANPRAIGGISLLTPQTQVTFRSRIEQFVDTYVRRAVDPPAPVAELAALDAAIGQLDDWKLVSQALTGLGDLVAMRDTRAHNAPDASVATDVADETHHVPYLTDSDGSDGSDGGTGAFSGVRQGQFAFTTLIVYDAFGQVLQLVGGTGPTDPQNFAPIRDASLTPRHPVITRNPQRLVEAPPRVTQGARLDFELVDALDDTQVVRPGAQANPVGGWVLPDHLDHSLLLYAPDGGTLGSLRLLADERGTTTTRWEPPPHSTLTLADVDARAHRLAQMITEPTLADPAVFGAFLATVDSTLWTIDPLGNRADVNLSVLVGRPLALVRARLRLTLEGPPVTDQSSWATAWPPPAPAFLSDAFAVRLGDQATRSDGLIGYFTGDDTATFHCVADPAAATPYLSRIGPPGDVADPDYLHLRFGDTAPQTVTMLVDPRAGVHAGTGILPVTSLRLPERFVDGPLSALEVAFTVGALPTVVVPAPGSQPPPEHPLSVGLPMPIEQRGTWTWWERAADGPDAWTPYGLARATPGAGLTDLPSSVRDGYLQLTVDLTVPPTDIA